MIDSWQISPVVHRQSARWRSIIFRFYSRILAFFPTFAAQALRYFMSQSQSSCHIGSGVILFTISASIRAFTHLLYFIRPVAISIGASFRTSIELSLIKCSMLLFHSLAFVAQFTYSNSSNTRSLCLTLPSFTINLHIFSKICKDHVSSRVIHPPVLRPLLFSSASHHFHLLLPLMLLEMYDDV